MLKTISKAMIFSLCVALPASAQATLKSVLERYAQAINLPQLKTVRGLRQTGEFVWGGETRCRYRCDIVQTGYRSEVTLQGMTAVSAYEPAGGWQIAPFGGRTEPEKLTADESKSMGWATNLVGPLLDPQHDGAKLEYLGLKDVEGTDSHCIRVVRPSGDVELHYLDPDHFLPIRLRRTKLVRGVTQEEELDFGDYRQVNGIYFPFVTEMGRPGSTKGTSIELKSIELNPQIEASEFVFPGASNQKGGKNRE